MILYDYSGVNGSNGYPGQCGSDGIFGSRGGNGERGGAAQNGTPGLKMDISLVTNGIKVKVDEYNKKIPNDTINLGDQRASLSLVSCGGHGGHGGAGGNGGDGGNGISGRDASKHSCGTNGSPGGDGGDGADGGDGGNGGDGGSISVSVNDSDMDLLMLVENVQFPAGKLGDGGPGGVGGSGGIGGRGGSGYSWTETTYVNGQSVSSRTITNPGGYSGPDGRRGRNGIRGREGRDGREGDFCYYVSGNRFPSRYDLVINSVEKVVSRDGIIEPGETLQIKMMEIKNTGGMHTPNYQGVILSLIDNEWVHFKEINQVQMRNGLPSGGVYLLETPLTFQIKDWTHPVSDDIFKARANVDYRATVERVNKQFAQIAKQNDFYEIRHPVVISKPQLLRSITNIEESPFAIQIWNKSSQALGSMSQEGRLLNFRLMLMDTKQTVEFVGKNVLDFQKQGRNTSQFGEKALNQQNYITPVQEEMNNVIIEQDFITYLEPNSKTTISGTIKLKDLDLPLYTKIKMQAKLDLGYYHQPRTTFQNIQIRNFHIQLTEGHSFNVNSDFLLIFNCDTPKEMIDSIKTLAHSFGSGVDLWNISNYQGFSFDFIVMPENKPFKHLYKNRVIIIYNNIFTNTQSQKTNAVKEIREAQLFKAVQEHGMSICIFNDSQKDYDSFYLLNPQCQFEGSIQTGIEEIKLYEQIAQDKKDEEQVKNFISQEIKNQLDAINDLSFNSAYTLSHQDSITCCSDPKPQMIENKAKNILKNLEQRYPRLSYFLAWDYKPSMVESNTFTKVYKFGNITIAESLRKDKSQIIQRQRPSMIQFPFFDENDIIAILKALSFERKITFLDRSFHDVKLFNPLMKAIVSDLCDEYSTFQNIDQNTMQLQINLEKWSTFTIYPLNEKFQAALAKLKEKSTYNPPQMKQSDSQNYSTTNRTMEDSSTSEISNPNVLLPPPQIIDQNIPPLMIQPPLDSINQEIQVSVEQVTSSTMNVNISAPAEVLQNKNIILNQPLLNSTPQATIQTPLPLGKDPVKQIQEVKQCFIKYLIEFKCALYKQLTFGQKYFCSCAASKVVTKHCITILENVLQKLEVAPQDLLRITSEKTNSLKQITKPNALAEFQRPYLQVSKSLKYKEEVLLSNHSLSSIIKERKAVPSFRFDPKEKIYIQQGSFIFFNDLNQQLNEEKRQEKIMKFENSIFFDDN